ncbi:hypothetical protein [Dokdonia sp.]|uniref:hypothetical protein n=1 Tax=Dokdonia sp. TaxID=2024995 RepID=UPI00326569EC
MKNYLVFFGKSQDFTIEVFDVNGIVTESNPIFNSLHLLESGVFTIDDPSNKEILAKYNFADDKQKYSLLKLYSLAQAVDGTRISGSIYGVAFLSTSNLKISETNNKLLKSLKEEFSKLSLNKRKFNKSNFREDVFKIWKAFVTQNYFDKIKTTQRINIAKNQVNLKAFLVDNIILSSVKFDNEIKNTSRLYFSNDKEHLIRTHKKWGDKFTFFENTDDKLIKYESVKIEAKPEVKSESGSDSIINAYEVKIFNLKYKKQKISKKYKRAKKRFNKKIKLLSIICLLPLLSLGIFFFNDNLIFDKENPENSTNTITKAKEGEIILEEKMVQNSLSNFNILNNDDIIILSNLSTNLKKFNSTKDSNKSLKIFDAIRRDSDYLHIDLSYFDKRYNALKLKSEQISKLLNSKKLDSINTKDQLKSYLEDLGKANKEKLSDNQNDILRELQKKTRKKIKDAN